MTTTVSSSEPVGMERLLARAQQIADQETEKLLARTFVFMVFYEDFFERSLNPSLDDHRELLAALRDKDPNRAAGLMHAHIRASVEDLRRTYERPEKG